MINNILLTPPQSYEVPASLDNTQNLENEESTFQDMLKNSSEESNINENTDNEKTPVQSSNDTKTSYENDNINNDNLGSGNNKKSEDEKNSDARLTVSSDEKDLDKKEKKIKIDEIFFFDNINVSKTQNEELKIGTSELIEDIETLIANIEELITSENVNGEVSKDDIDSMLVFLDSIKNVLKGMKSLESNDFSQNKHLSSLKSLLTNDTNVHDIKTLLSNTNESDISEEFKNVMTKLEKIVELKDFSFNTKERDIKPSSESKNIETFNSIDRDTNYNKFTKNSGMENGDSSGGKEDNAAKNVAKPNTINTENTTEFTIVNAKDDFSKSEFINSSSKVMNQSKSDSSEALLKFQDVMSKLVDKARMALSNGKTEIIMALKPESLGNISLKITMEGDEIRGKVFLDNAEVKDIFTKNIDSVIKSLSEVGINIEGFDVMLKQDMPNAEQEEFSEILGERRHDNNKANLDIDNALMIDKYLLPERKLNIVI